MTKQNKNYYGKHFKRLIPRDPELLEALGRAIKTKPATVYRQSIRLYRALIGLPDNYNVFIKEDAKK